MSSGIYVSMIIDLYDKKKKNIVEEYVLENDTTIAFAKEKDDKIMYELLGTPYHVNTLYDKVLKINRFYNANFIEKILLRIMYLFW